MSLLKAFLNAPSIGSLFSVITAQRTGCIETEISYGDHQRHKLDVYHPVEDKPAQAIILFVYGGGWDSGQRQMYGFVGASLAARGYLTIIPDYRLFPEARYPAFMSDITSAYHWMVEANAAAIAAGTPVIVMGHSAGAHMGALLTYDVRYLSNLGTRPTPPTGFIGLSGPYGFDAKAHDRTRDVFATAATEQEIKPTAQVRNGAPNALLFHGTKDETVQTLNAIRLQENLRAVGSDAAFFELESAGHMAPLIALSRFYGKKFEILPRIDQFIAQNK